MAFVAQSPDLDQPLPLAARTLADAHRVAGHLMASGLGLSSLTLFENGDFVGDLSRTIDRPVIAAAS